ncbi:MAG: LLM class F420-dependent oxidoreductase [Actinobacteria bacterium]|nr:LLM class F420-dependent oxidoreductase [Actinomycetota bacterium]
MKVDGTIGFSHDTPAAARRAEELGYDGVLSAETNTDPFLPLLLAAEHTRRLELGTAITVAFARSPMTTAAAAHNLQTFSKGRFILGLGSQIKPHIEKRFSMPWSRPTARMREFVVAVRAIWDCWDNGTKLDFQGEFYRHTLMTPFFTPRASEHGPPKVFLAAVGEHMSEVAGEVADGVLAHAFTTERYLRGVTVPAIERGAAKAGRTRADVELSLSAFIVTAETEEAMEVATTAVRQQIAFYASTPAYRGVLELHGWGELQTELNALSKQGEWAKMGDAIDDTILETFAVVGEPDIVSRGLAERYGDLVDRFRFYAPYPISDATAGTLIERIKA